jgi:hypothetical protein
MVSDAKGLPVDFLLAQIIKSGWYRPECSERIQINKL